jgi:hypothetical protein
MWSLGSLCTLGSQDHGRIVMSATFRSRTAHETNEVSSMATRLASSTKQQEVGRLAIAPIERRDLGLRVAQALSRVDAILLGGAAAAGLLVDHLYRDPPSVAAMFRGYDLVALAIIAPSIAVALMPRFRRSPRTRLV